MGQLESILLSVQNTQETGPLEAMGAASDSAVLLAEVAGLVTLITLVIVLLVRQRGLYGKSGMMWRKPLLLPSFAFIFVIILSLNVAWLPISEYRSYNSVYSDNYPDDVDAMTVYGGPAYVTTLELAIDGWFGDDSSLNVIVSLWQNLTYVTGTTLSSGHVVEAGEVYEKTSFSAPEGVYQVTFNMTYITSGLPSETGPTADVYLSQVLVEGHFQEILTWETYRLGLIATGIVFLLAGICSDTGTRSIKKIDGANG